VRTLATNAPRTASEKGCKFCLRREAPGGCPTFDTFMLELFGKQFDDLDDEILIGAPMELPVVITPERRSYILDNRKLSKRGWTSSTLRRSTTRSRAPLRRQERPSKAASHRTNGRTSRSRRDARAAARRREIQPQNQDTDSGVEGTQARGFPELEALIERGTTQARARQRAGRSTCNAD
jgi:hypothetical protein